MTSYIISQIKQSDKRAHKQRETLLSKAGLSSHQPTDFTLGIFDHNYDLLATGSLLGNQLHSIIVDHPHRGKGILNQLITHLHDQRFQAGHKDLCITVPDELRAIFRSLGFHEIKKMSQDTIYMGNCHAVKLYQE